MALETLKTINCESEPSVIRSEAPPNFLNQLIIL